MNIINECEYLMKILGMLEKFFEGDESPKLGPLISA